VTNESSVDERSKGDRNGDELVAEAKQGETGTRVGIRADTQRRRVLNGLALVGFVLPVAFLFWLIHIDAVNMLRADQWDAIRLIQQSDSGKLSLGVLWAQHTENRIFFQNLITLLLAHTTNFNILVEDYVSGALLVAAAAVLVVTHRRRSPSRPWIFYCPVVIVMLSAAVWGVTLFGFQIGWSLIMLSLAGTLFLLDRPRVTGLVLAAAVAAAVVGSFSSLEGLIIWPAGLVLLCQRHRSRRQILAWSCAALATAGLYFHNWTGGGNQTFYAFAHPIAGAKFFFFAIGDVVGVQTYNTSSSDDVFVEILGVVIVTIALWVVITYGFRRDETSGRPLGVSLIWFGLLFAVAITAARSSNGLSAAAASRYTLFDLLIVVGSYLVVIDRPEPALRVGRRRQLLPVMSAVVLAVTGLQIVVGTSEGLINAQTYHEFQLVGADVTVNIDHAPVAPVETYLASGQTVSYIQRMTAFARAHRLAMFSTAAAAVYAKEGLPKTPPATNVTSPYDGETLKGPQWLLAAATDEYGVSKVEFDFTGKGRGSTLIGPAALIKFGWIDRWSTASVPDGTYTLRSVAYGASGGVSSSPGVVVHVEN
jgi:hypothetical protein